jgi:hypothetical protein
VALFFSVWITGTLMVILIVGGPVAYLAYRYIHDRLRSRARSWPSAEATIQSAAVAISINGAKPEETVSSILSIGVNTHLEAQVRMQDPILRPAITWVVRVAYSFPVGSEYYGGYSDRGVSSEQAGAEYARGLPEERGIHRARSRRSGSAQVLYFGGTAQEARPGRTGGVTSRTRSNWSRASLSPTKECDNVLYNSIWRTMPSRKTAVQKETSLAPDRALRAITEQLDGLQKLKGRRYDEAEAEEMEWKHLARSIIEGAFGDPSSPLSSFHKARAAGQHSFSVEISPRQKQINFELRIKEQEALLRSSCPNERRRNRVEYALRAATLAVVLAGFLPPSLMHSIGTIFYKVTGLFSGI